MDTIRQTIERLSQPHKGILAADESNRTAGKRLDQVGLENTEENRQKFRDILLCTEGIEQYLSGVILYDETIRQNALDGTPFREVLKNKGIAIGIKVDGGTVDFSGFPGEELTEGLDGLPRRLKEYKDLGAEFTKFRCVFRISETTPTMEAIHLNSIILARYARLVQDAGMVPILEPEVLFEGTHTIERSHEVIENVLKHMFYEVERLRADLGGLVLKTSMALDGSEHGIEATPDEVARHTVEALRASVPDTVPLVVFLSGGQLPYEATEHLARIAEHEPLPWEIAFSFARALQQPMLDVWAGKDENIEAARKVFLQTLQENVLADKGIYE